MPRLAAFGTRGYEATSLDTLAAALGVRKQTILYHFPSKEALLDAVIDEAGAELIAVLERAVSGLGRGMVPDRRGGAIGVPPGRPPPRAARAAAGGQPAGTAVGDPVPGDARSVYRAGHRFLEEAWTPGEFRRQDARLLLLATYSTVIGVATEVEVLRALGIEPSVRSLVRRRAELLAFLRSALLPDGPRPGPERGCGPTSGGLAPPAGVGRGDRPAGIRSGRRPAGAASRPASQRAPAAPAYRDGPVWPWAGCSAGWPWVRWVPSPPFWRRLRRPPPEVPCSDAAERPGRLALDPAGPSGSGRWPPCAGAGSGRRRR